MATDNAATPEKIERKPEATLYIPNKKEAPDGLSDVGLGKEITFKVKGKAKRISQDDWDGGSINVTVEITDLSIESSGDPITLDDAIQKARKIV